MREPRSTPAELDRCLSRRDLVVGSLIALVIGSVFALLGSGRSLLVTFVPGMAIAWALFVWMGVRRRPLPPWSSFVPLFFGALGVQLLHFTEELVTGFAVRFPGLYGGAPYDTATFVVFNLTAYTIFGAACVVGFRTRLRFLLIPVLFFLVYGTVGNAVAHTWWSVLERGYFPGLLTAQVYWVLGPLLLSRLFGWRTTTVVVVTFGCVLVPLLTFFRV